MPVFSGKSHDMPHSLVAGAGGGLRIWKAGTDILNKQLRIADKGWFSILVFFFLVSWQQLLTVRT
jgi:hypothetical protein